MYSDVLAGINSIKSSLNSIGGNYIYTPGSGYLFSGSGSTDSTISDGHYKKIGEFIPKYNGVVTFKNTTTLSSNYGSLYPLSLNNAEIPLFQGTTVSNRINHIMTEISVQRNYVNLFSVSVAKNASCDMLVWAGIPVYVYAIGNQGMYNWTVSGSIVKI